MEVIACGTPIVGINNVALSETINTGENGQLYERSNIDSFAAVLETVIGDY